MTQAEVDSVVVRVKMLVEKLGKNSARLTSVRRLYKMFSDRPEPGSFGLLTAAVSEVEEEVHQTR
jgi:hypothetical protein